MKIFPNIFMLIVLLVFPLARLNAQQKVSDIARYEKIMRLIQPQQIPYNASIEDSIHARLQNIRTENNIHTRFSCWKNYFSEAITKQGLPSYFQYLPLVLSRMEVQAQGSYDRAGVWMISRLTATRYKLRCDSLIDERFDPKISSKVAATELKRLLNLYEGNVWECLLAYCVSPSAINAQKIRLQNDNPSPWTLQQNTQYFPENVIASFLSWVFVIQAEEGNSCPKDSIFHIYTERPFYRHHFTERITCSNEIFRFNNPSLIGDKIPSGILLNLTQAQHSQWNIQKDSLYFLFEYQKILDSIIRVQDDSLKQVLDSIQKQQELKRQAKIAAEKAAGKTIYVVKNGDVLGKIAHKYNVSVADIKRWNHQKSDMIQIGQKLIIYRK